MARDMETVIRISGDLDASLRRAIEQAAAQIEELNRAAEQSADAVDALSDTIKDQSSALKQAQKQYAAYVLSGEESSDQARDLADEIQRLARELKDNKSAMSAAERAAKQLADGYDDAEDQADDLGNTARKSGGGFTVMKGAMADLVSSGIQSLIGACANAVSSLYGLADSTREFRQDMSTLETAFDSAGFSTEAATETWKDLYSLFGEDDRAVEAANNIARIADSQAELDEWTRITAGVWGTYQDALPVESLAEAAAETIRTGTSTGALSDSLNWSSEAAAMFADYMGGDVVTAEDAFNAALAECTTEAERNALVTDTLLDLYGDAADTYYESADSLIEANKAQADYNLSLADMGEKIEPVTTAVKAGLAGMLGAALDLFAGADMEGFAEKITDGFERVTEVIMPIAQKILPSLGRVIGTVLEIAAPIGELVGEIAGAVLPVLAEAIDQVFSAVAPIIPIITELVTNLLPIITTLVQGLAPIVSMLLTALTPVMEAISTVVSYLIPPLMSVINALIPVVQFLASVISDTLGVAMQAIMPIINNVMGVFSGLIDFIKNVFTGNWKGAWEAVKDIFKNAFDALAQVIKAPINAVISIVNKVIDAINSIGFDIPGWVPIVGGKSFRINIPKIPLLAEGGFTDGVSIAGEAGTEAVISFDRAVRSSNLGYWAQAGRMLGATPEDAGFATAALDEYQTYRQIEIDPVIRDSGRTLRAADDSGFELSGYGGDGVVIDMGGVTFAPQITINGDADKESIVEAIEDEYPEFLDMLERWLSERRADVFA